MKHGIERQKEGQERKEDERERERERESISTSKMSFQIRRLLTCKDEARFVIVDVWSDFSTSIVKEWYNYLYWSYK